MKARILIVLLSAIFIGIPMIIFAQQEQITITTYYPSPYGNYRELRAQRMAIGDTYVVGSSYCWEGTCTTTIDPNAVLVVEGNVGIGTTSPGARLDVNGQIRIRGGGPAAGRVLTSDASGLATWQASTSSIGPLAIAGMRHGETGYQACSRVAARYGGFWNCILSFTGDANCADATGAPDNEDFAMCFNSANSPGNALSIRAAD